MSARGLDALDVTEPCVDGLTRSSAATGAVVGPGRVSNLGRQSPEAELRRGCGRSERKRPGGEPQVLQDGLGGGGAKDDGHHAARVSAARAGEDVNLAR